MTYPEALTYLGQARRFGMKLGLEPMRELARGLGSPQDRLRFIHLAGTNGKGSTAAFSESCLRVSGFRVGLYTSPHLVSVRERIQINREPISENDFAEGMTHVRDVAEKQLKREVTFFELMTALALWYFGREKVDWVVWETGLGGRLDATNIVMPEVCIITNIGLDHQQYLGQTLAEIAAEKAGIIKPGVPVVSAVEKGAAADVIRDRKKQKKCLGPLLQFSEMPKDLGLLGGKQWAEITMGFQKHDFMLGLIGSHQVLNAACAVAAMDQIRWGHGRTFNPADHPKITTETVAQGLASTMWPGRFEILSDNPLVVLDGAHNPAGMKMLVETWRAFLSAKLGWTPDQIAGRTHLVFATAADKDISEMVTLLRPLVKDVALVRLANERGADPSTLANSFAGLPCVCHDTVADAWKNMNKSPESTTLITGSLFLVGEMLARRQGNGGEYRLNERLEKQVGSPLVR